MNHQHPLVSIISPVRNASADIAACLESVLAQDYPAIEHLVIDGASTDGTVDILREYAARHPRRIRYVSERDAGPGDAWSKGVRMAGGDILGCLGADDRCEPGAIGAVVAFFRERADAMFVHGGCRQVFDDGSVLLHQPAHFDFRSFVNTAREIATPAAYYRRGIFDRIGPAEECGDDFELMLRIAEAFPIHRVDATLATLGVRMGTAFNPADPRKRAMARRDSYRISRRHGGSRVSRMALRYYWAAAAALFGITPLSPLARGISRAARAMRSA